MKGTIVVSFGCPRSGTMFMRNLLQDTLPCFSTKLPEMVDMHPAQSATGLLALSGLFYKRTLVLVRTKRHPVQIVESFVHLRKANPTTPRARDDDKAVRRWITQESRGVARQRVELGEMRRRRGHHFVEVRYESLNTSEGREAFAERLGKVVGCGAKPIRRGLDQSWGNRSAAYAGRLKSGVDSVLTDDRRAWWEHALEPIIHREGYAS